MDFALIDKMLHSVLTEREYLLYLRIYNKLDSQSRQDLSKLLLSMRSMEAELANLRLTASNQKRSNSDALQGTMATLA